MGFCFPTSSSLKISDVLRTLSAAFDLAYLKPLEYDFSLDFSRLVLPSGHQDTITGLVEGHVAVKRPRRALALHLHGMPGVGKGTTASMCSFSSTHNNPDVSDGEDARLSGQTDT